MPPFCQRYERTAQRRGRLTGLAAVQALTITAGAMAIDLAAMARTD